MSRCRWNIPGYQPDTRETGRLDLDFAYRYHRNVASGERRGQENGK